MEPSPWSWQASRGNIHVIHCNPRQSWLLLWPLDTKCTEITRHQHIECHKWITDSELFVLTWLNFFYNVSNEDSDFHSHSRAAMYQVSPILPVPVMTSQNSPLVPLLCFASAEAKIAGDFSRERSSCYSLITITSRIRRSSVMSYLSSSKSTLEFGLVFNIELNIRAWPDCDLATDWFWNNRMRHYTIIRLRLYMT